MIFEEALGAASRRDPRAATVEGVLQVCSVDLDCAYELGRLVAKRYREVKEIRNKDYALKVYLEAVRNVEVAVTPDSLEERVNTEMERIDGREDHAEDDYVNEDEEERANREFDNSPTDTGFFDDWDENWEE